jgi:hypothetical protein
MKNKRYIFTATSGRSGQETLANLFDRCTDNTFSSFESPMIDTIFKGKLSAIEHKLRRRFIETNELLGRGKVIKAYNENDINYINKIAQLRIKTINKKLEATNNSTYIDISKFFIRGLHLGFCNALPKISIINLVRDPLMNMKSFINRRKNFNLDNNLPDSASNFLKLDSSHMSKEELYLWAWFEMNLRFESLTKKTCVESHVEICTEKLSDPWYLADKLKKINLDYNTNAHLKQSLNSNTSIGIIRTAITQRDIDIFHNFLEKVPKKLMQKISYLDNYDPKVNIL